MVIVDSSQCIPMATRHGKSLVLVLKCITKGIHSSVIKIFPQRQFSGWNISGDISSGILWGISPGGFYQGGFLYTDTDAQSHNRRQSER